MHVPRSLLPVVVALCVALLAVWARYGLVESHEIAQRCLAEHGAGVCVLRAGLITLFKSGLLGVPALLATGAALHWRNRISTASCLALGAAGLVLYCFQTGALAVLVGALLLLPAKPAT